MAHSGCSSAVVVAPKDFTAEVQQEHLLAETIYWSDSKTLSHDSFMCPNTVIGTQGQV